jgi:hypothetical protein
MHGQQNIKKGEGDLIRETGRQEAPKMTFL